jgi:hypothetical protein
MKKTFIFKPLTFPNSVRFSSREKAILVEIAKDESIPFATFLRSMVLTNPKVKARLERK